MLRSLVIFLSLGVLLSSCTANVPLPVGVSSITPSAPPATVNSPNVCPLTEPLWAKPPEDPAVQGSPGYGSYFVNDDRSIWASASWTRLPDSPLRVSADGIKVGWFRPAGAPLEITGQRTDIQAPPLEAHVPCCYPTRFQATGLYFPTEGCWKVTARAADRELVFVVWVEP